MASAAAPAPGASGDQLGAIAARLTDIAGTVAREAEAATALVRGMSDQAREMAALAASLRDAADAMEAGVRRQAEALAAAKHSLAANRPAIDALAQSVESVASISAIIAGIARQSRVLGLNARIEASRSGSDALGFTAVAQEMSTLATRTKLATDDIAERAAVIGVDVGAAHAIVVSHGELVDTQEALLGATLDGVGRHREAAAALAAITTGSAGTIDRAATAMGRIGASAAAVRVLARQVARLVA